MNINLNTIIKINKIIERDKLESSYKLALLKSLILTIKKFDHHIIKNDKFVKIPFYFIVEEWFFYYIPFVFLDIKQHKSKKLVLTSKIEILYKDIFANFDICQKEDWKCIYSMIYKKYYNFELDVKKIFREFRKLIKDNPMKYMGEKNHEIFPKDKITIIKSVNRKKFEEFGFFEIEKDIYYTFKYLGDNFYGINTIISRWEELLNKINIFSELKNIKEILIHNIDEIIRDTSEVRKIFNNETLYCVWSGKKIKKYDIDHMLPFSVFFNNDYWNLLPADKKVNNDKRDKIPSIDLIEKSEDRILYYWELYQKEFKEFNNQRFISLGKFSNEKDYINQIKKKSDFFINTLGYQEFYV